MDSPQWGFYALVRPQEVDIELVFTTKCCLLDHFDELVASFWHGIIFSPFSFLIRFLSSLFSERCLVKSFSSIQLYERNLKLIQRSRESVQVLISLRSDGTFYYFSITWKIFIFSTFCLRDAELWKRWLHTYSHSMVAFRKTNSQKIMKKSIIIIFNHFCWVHKVLHWNEI